MSAYQVRPALYSMTNTLPSSAAQYGETQAVLPPLHSTQPASSSAMHWNLQLHVTRHHTQPDCPCGYCPSRLQLTTHSLLAPLGILIPWQEVPRHFLVREE
jgi:hypothetical protein